MLLLLLRRSYVGDPQPASVTHNSKAASTRTDVMAAILSRDHGNRAQVLAPRPDAV